MFRKLFKKTLNLKIDDSSNLVVVNLYINKRRTAFIQCVKQNDYELLLGDITHVRKELDYCKGYGSMMMEKLIEYTTENNFKELHGNLSKIDKDHKDRLHHFYKKFGFDINIFDEPKDLYYGSVSKFL